MTTEIIFNARGVRIKAELLKLNPTRALIKVKEAVDKFRVDSQWRVGYNFITTMDGRPITRHGVGTKEVSVDAFKMPTNLPNDPSQETMPTEFWVAHNVPYLEALAGCYAGLSPENLSCDGEASRAHMASRSRLLHQRIHALEVLMERKVSEDLLYKIEGQYKDAFIKHHQSVLNYLNR